MAVALTAIAATRAAAHLSAQAVVTRPDSSIAQYCARDLTADCACDLYDVSFIQLLATPERFEGRRVRFIGFLHLEFEGNAVYLHHEDMDAGLLKNGLWVEFRSGVATGGKGVNNRYVILEGQFTQHDRGHLGLWSGTLRDISRADPWNVRRPAARPPKPPR